MQFIKNGPDIPEELLEAQEEGRVVFFCGAGISYPAGLPGFGGLVNKIYDNELVCFIYCYYNFNTGSFSRSSRSSAICCRSHLWAGSEFMRRCQTIMIVVAGTATGGRKMSRPTVGAT